MRSFRQQGCSCHDLSALAISALRNILSDPGSLQRVQSIRAEPFNSCHILSCGLRNRQGARTRESATNMNAACAAKTCATSELGTSQLQRVAQYPEQGSFGGDIDFSFGTVYGESNSGHGRINPRRNLCERKFDTARASNSEEGEKRRAHF